jgi:hypothetical protein
VAFAKLANEYYRIASRINLSGHLEKFRLNQMTGVDIVASAGKAHH